MGIFGTDIYNPVYTTEYSVLTDEGVMFAVPLGIILLGVWGAPDSKITGYGLVGIGAYLALKQAKVL